MDTSWVLCPVCQSKTRLKLLPDTVLQHYPLFCPKCKNEVLINARDLVISIVPGQNSPKKEN